VAGAVAGSPAAPGFAHRFDAVALLAAALYAATATAVTLGWAAPRALRFRPGPQLS
jgi:hypothetical protein